MAVELFFEVFFFKCALADKSSLAKLVVSVHCILWKNYLCLRVRLSLPARLLCETYKIMSRDMGFPTI